MDNASYHSVKKIQYRQCRGKKQKITDWSENKGEIIDRPMVRDQLMEKVNALRPLHNQYVIDELAKEHTKIVLRLPPYHCELNPIESAWSSVKHQVKINNTTFKIPDIQKLLYEGMERVTPEMWCNFERHVRKEEDKFWEIDFINDELLDNATTDDKNGCEISKLLRQLIRTCILNGL